MNLKKMMITTLTLGVITPSVYAASVSRTEVICFEDRISLSDWDANDFCMECNMVYDDAAGSPGPGEISAACTPLTAGSADSFKLIANPALGSGDATFTHHRGDGNFDYTASSNSSLGSKYELFSNISDWKVNLGGSNNDPKTFAVTFNSNHGLGASFDISDLFALYNNKQSQLISNQVDGAIVLVLPGGHAPPEEYVDFYDAYELGSASVDSKCNPKDPSFDMSGVSGCDRSALASAMTSASISSLDNAKVRKTPVDVSKKAMFKVAPLDTVSASVASFDETTSYTAGFNSSGSVSSDTATFLSESGGALSGYNLKKQRKLCHLFGFPCGGGSPGGGGGGGLGAMPAPAINADWTMGASVIHTSLLYVETNSPEWNLEIAISGENHYEYSLVGEISSGSCPTDPSGFSSLTNLHLSSSTQLTAASSGGYFHYGFRENYVELSRSPWSTDSYYNSVTSTGVFPGGNDFLVHDNSGISSGDTTYTAFVEHSFDNYGSWDYIGSLTLISCSSLSTEANCNYYSGCSWDSFNGTCGDDWMQSWGDHGYLSNGSYSIPSTGSYCFYSVWGTVNTTDISTLMSDSNTSVSNPTQGTIEIDVVDNNVDTSSSSGCSSVSGGSYQNVYDGDMDGVFGQCVEVKLGHTYGSSNQVNDASSGTTFVSGNQIPITIESP